VTTDFGGTESARTIAVAPDGKIVVAGYHFHDPDALADQAALARYSTESAVGAGTISLAGSALTVTGTGASDTIALKRVGEEIEVSIAAAGNSNANVQRVAVASVKSIEISAGNGADKITIGDGIIGVSASGNAGYDYILGGSGNDRLSGGSGRDTLIGGSGDDVLDGGSSGDYFYGGGGSDTADYSSRTENLFLSVDNIPNDGSAGEGDNIAVTTEKIKGGSGNDKITGDSGANVLYGNGGNDTFTGLGGSDALYGQAGDDLFEERDGVHDYIDGGSGVNDRARRDDPLDTAVNVETFIA
jgi:Ca2+-binding RTX toxin-like protein